jgi:hypothetical protein
MSAESMDYTAFLADLEAKKAALEHTIASFRQAMAVGALGQMTGDGTVPSMSSSSMTGGEVPAGAFLGKSITEATRLYLEIVKKKQTTREVADALQKGGMESTSKGDFANIVHAGLTRARKSPNSGIVKVGKHWGLASWYPKGIISSVSATPARKGKKKKAVKAVKPAAVPTAAAAAAPVWTPPQPVPISTPKPGATDGIADLLRSQPGKEFSGPEIANEFNLKNAVAYMLLGKLLSKQQVEKTPEGKYRAIVSHETAQAHVV